MPSQVENLYHREVAGEYTRGTTSPAILYNALTNEEVVLADVGLAVGDVVSASADIVNETPGDGVRLELTVRNSGDGVVQTTVSDYIEAPTLTRVSIENVTLPATADDIVLRIRRESGTGNIAAHRGMINRGPTAAAYAVPFRTSVFSLFPPEVPIRKSRPRTVEAKSRFDSFGQSPIYQEYNLGRSDYWEMVLTTTDMTARMARFLIAWARSVGIGGQVALRDPDHLGPGYDGVRDYMLNGFVNGASQTGRTLVTNGWPASSLILSRGDNLSFILGQYFYATDDVVSNGAGQATIPIWPAIRTSPIDGAVVEINDPHLLARILTVPEYDSDEMYRVDMVSLAFEEDR